MLDAQIAKNRHHGKGGVPRHLFRQCQAAHLSAYWQSGHGAFRATDHMTPLGSRGVLLHPLCRAPSGAWAMSHSAQGRLSSGTIRFWLWSY
jgi:hypothetical protein